MPAEPHKGEVYGCTFTPDGSFVLSAGWDGQLRLWDISTGEIRLSLPASPKPLACCACSPDGQQWLAGSMEGMLSLWDGVSQQSLYSFIAHTRPISAIVYAPSGELLATASWDRQIALRTLGKEREARVLSGHQDIVTGCRFTIDGKQLISWSHDRTIKIWDLVLARDVATLSGHTDRVTSLSLSPDGQFAISGGRDAMVRLWDLDTMTEVATVNIGAEVRACYYLLDAESVVVADAVGRLFLMSVPSFQVQMQVQTPFKVMCGELSPSGSLLVLGGEDGHVHFVAIEGFENASLVVTPVQNLKPQSGLFDRFFGTTRMKRTFSYTCPSCRQVVESNSMPAQIVSCPRCRRRLRINQRLPEMQMR